MSDQQQLQLIRQQTLTQLIDLRANPKPTYSIDGQMVSWSEYAAALQRTIDWCDVKLVGIEPFEVRSRAVT
jgi:hypothetical protein